MHFVSYLAPVFNSIFFWKELLEFLHQNMFAMKKLYMCYFDSICIVYDSIMYIDINIGLARSWNVEVKILIVTAVLWVSRLSLVSDMGFEPLSCFYYLLIGFPSLWWNL